MTTKLCPRCRENPRQLPHDLCRACNTDRCREYRLSHPETVNAIYRAYRLRHPERIRFAAWRQSLRRHGLTPERLWKLILYQGGQCALCGASGKRLTLDHDHTTGLRGALCVGCNRHLERKPGAAAYKLNPPSIAAIGRIKSRYVSEWDKDRRRAAMALYDSQQRQTAVKLCPRCGVNPRQPPQRYCPPCNAAKVKAWRLVNPDKWSAIRRRCRERRRKKLDEIEPQQAA